MERINILWTGGFDSTFRVCQLSLFGVEIQPFYISIKNRKSEPYELKAIADISNYIHFHKDRKCKLLPVSIINQDDIMPYEAVTNSLRALKEEFMIGYQYDFMTRFARQQNIMLEVGFEYDPLAHEHTCFEKYGELKKVTMPVPGGIIEYYELNPEKSTEDILNVFGSYRYGLPLFHMNRVQTVQAYKEMGYEEVIPMTWFCAHPLFGKPCGLCIPCEGYMESDMSFRLPWRARTLYKVFKKNKTGKSIDRKLKAIYNRYFRSNDGGTFS